MSGNSMYDPTQGSGSNGPCPVPSKEQIPLTNNGTMFKNNPITFPAVFKIPVVIAEPTLQIVVESTINLATPATEIKRVKKHVFLNQVKLIPVAFARIGAGSPTPTDYFSVTRAKVFVAGHIRKNIEYATGTCSGPLMDQVADVPFSGFTDISIGRGGGILTPPIIGISETAEANFLNENTQMGARLDKVFFENLVIYNDQPYGELVAANMFELDFSPTIANPEGTFTQLTEKIVLDLTFKVLQVQQVKFAPTPPSTETETETLTETETETVTEIETETVTETETGTVTKSETVTVTETQTVTVTETETETITETGTETPGGI